MAKPCDSVVPVSAILSHIFIQTIIIIKQRAKYVRVVALLTFIVVYSLYRCKLSALYRDSVKILGPGPGLSTCLMHSVKGMYTIEKYVSKLTPNCIVDVNIDRHSQLHGIHNFMVMQILPM